MGDSLLRRELLVSEYEAVAVPDPLVTIELDADPIVREVSADFFENIVKATRLGKAALPLLLRIEHYCLHPNDARHSDDFDERLLLEGFQPLAMVHKTRTDMNAMVVSYSKIPLRESSISKILQFQTEDNKES